MTTARKNFAVAIMPVALLVVVGMGLRYLPYLFPADDAKASDEPPVVVRRRAHAPRPPVPVLKPQPVDTATQRRTEQAAGGQIAAFGRGDFAGALEFSAPNFRSQMSPERFHDLILGQYSALLTPSPIHFGTALRSGEIYLLPVSVGSGLAQRHFMYQLVQPDTQHVYVMGCVPMGGPPPEALRDAHADRARDTVPPDMPIPPGGRIPAL